MTLWRRLVRRPATGPAVDWLVVGLGNPGDRYAHTRHNVGRDAVVALAARWDVPLDRVRDNARCGQGRLGLLRVLLASPLTYMNESGRAVAPLARFYRLAPGQVLVVCDDLDLPLGVTRLRPGGGAGGHHGLDSLIATFGTDGFPRLRLGIGRPPPGWDAADYVLSRFARAEAPTVAAAIARAGDVVEAALADGIEAAMNRYN